MTTLSNQVFLLEEKIGILEKKILDLEEELSKKEKNIKDLKSELVIQNFKTCFFEKIISNNTQIKVSDILQIQGEEIKVRDFSGGNLNIYVEECTGDTKKYTVKLPKTTKKGLFRTINKPEIREPITKNTEREEKINNDMAETLGFNIDKDTLEKQLADCFEKVQKSRTGNIEKALETFRNTTLKFLGVLSVESYINFVKINTGKITTLLEKKPYEPKKIAELIQKSLNGIDMKITFYKKYHDFPVQIDELKRLKQAVLHHIPYTNEYVPFSVSNACKYICNYFLLFYPVKSICKTLLVNKYKFPNIVFLRREKYDPEDLYSFYILEKIENGKRYWKMECRLEDISKSISEQVRNYCISIFRKIYFDVFSDNTYRQDYTEKSISTKQECEQLINNIIFLSRGKQFCNYLRKIISKDNEIQPTENDKFNIFTDDILVKKNFTGEPPKDEWLIIKRMFDDITSEDCEKIWNEH